PGRLLRTRRDGRGREGLVRGGVRGPGRRAGGAHAGSRARHQGRRRMSKKNSAAGVVLLEVELLKALSHQKKVAVEVAWPDMTSLPLSGDTMQLDRMKVQIGRGPADDDTILDSPGSLMDFTWQASYDGGRSEEHTSELQSRENLVCRRL